MCQHNSRVFKTIKLRLKVMLGVYLKVKPKHIATYSTAVRGIGFQSYRRAYGYMASFQYSHVMHAYRAVSYFAYNSCKIVFRSS
jgi:hypothetical protein